MHCLYNVVIVVEININSILCTFFSGHKVESSAVVKYILLFRKERTPSVYKMARSKDKQFCDLPALSLPSSSVNGPYMYF